MVARVRAAGAIVVGKTNVPEFGAGANSRNFVWGATGNPFDPMLNPGGSSGGSAVALATEHAAGVHRLGHRRIAAHSRREMRRRRLPAFARSRAGRAAAALGWTPISVVGPMGRTVADTCLLMAAQAAFDDCDPLSYPVERTRLRGAGSVRPRRAARRLHGGFRYVARGQADPRASSASAIGAMRHLFRSCDEVAFDYFGEADRCFDVIRAQNYAARYRDAYEKDPSSLGPNVRANYEIAAKHVARRRGVGAHRADAHVPPLPADLPRLRPRARADDAGVAVSVVAALSRRDGRQAAPQLLPLALAHLRRHAR